jgi:hypothetical protein
VAWGGRDGDNPEAVDAVDAKQCSATLKDCKPINEAPVESCRVLSSRVSQVCPRCMLVGIIMYVCTVLCSGNSDLVNVYVKRKTISRDLHSAALPNPSAELSGH